MSIIKTCITIIIIINLYGCAEDSRNDENSVETETQKTLVEFSSSEMNFSENDGNVNVALNLSDIPSDYSDLDITLGGTAVYGEDYVLDSEGYMRGDDSALRLDLDSIEHNFIVSLISDDIMEEDKKIILSLSTSSESVDIGDKNELTINVADVGAWQLLGSKGNSVLDIDSNINDIKTIKFNEKIYVNWASTGTTKLLNLSVYNHDDADPAWIDIEGAFGEKSSGYLNPVNFTAVDNKLYTLLSDEETGEISIATYNGDDLNSNWEYINYNSENYSNKEYSTLIANNYISVLTTNTHLSSYGNNIIFSGNNVSLYDIEGNKLISIGEDENLGYIDAAKTRTQKVNSIKTFEYNSKLYAIFLEPIDSENFDSACMVRVAVFGGSTEVPVWSSLDGGNGLNPESNSRNCNSGDGYEYDLSEVNNKMYLTWSAFSNEQRSIYILEYNGDDNNPVWHTKGSFTMEAAARWDAGDQEIFNFNGSLHASWNDKGKIIIKKLDHDSNWVTITENLKVNTWVRSYEVIKLDSLYILWTEGGVEGNDIAYFAKHITQ